MQGRTDWAIGVTQAHFRLARTDSLYNTEHSICRQAEPRMSMYLTRVAGGYAAPLTVAILLVLFFVVLRCTQRLAVHSARCMWLAGSLHGSATALPLRLAYMLPVCWGD